MKMIVIILAIWFCIGACTINSRGTTENETADHTFLFQNPCWGIQNLEKLFIKWNWVKLDGSPKYIKGPLLLDFKIVRYNQHNEELFSINLLQTRKVSIPTIKQYKLFSGYYTYELYVKDLKKILINDADFFKNFEFDQFNAQEWEEKEELESMSESNSSGYREAFLISNQKKSCSSSFFAKTPHVLRITLLDQNELPIITANIALKQLKRAPTYFSPSELTQLGATYTGELYPATMNISLVLEQF